MLDLKALEQVLAPLEAIGQDELTFDAGGVEVTLRYMPPDAETEAQRWASEVLPKNKEDSDDMDTFAIAEYLDRFKVAVLSHALIKVGDQELGEHIETGETLENGAAVKLPRYKAMRQLLPKWGRPVLAAMFRKYAELMDKLDQKASKAIQFDATDLDAEIERVEARLVDLKRDKLRRLGDTEDDSGFAGKVQVAAAFEGERKAEVTADLEKMRDSARKRDEDAAAPAAEAPVETAPAEAAAPRERKPIIPEGAAPITAPSAPRVTPPGQPVSAMPTPAPVDTAFIDKDDPASAQAAVQAENDRLMAERMAPVVPEAIIPDTAPAPVRRPPHADARDVEAEMGAVQAGAAAVAQAAGDVGGIPAYRMPVQELGAKERPVGGSASVDPATADAGTRNPRFKPANTGV
jgi:hypothetical protein